ncbi:hypothetical protein TYRP_006776 [Tyrophagus putrescentiae]|nr:hypothetical protein TYRP_006776 [Tyrophagus putrescentiae]
MASASTSSFLLLSSGMKSMSLNSGSWSASPKNCSSSRAVTKQPTWYHRKMGPNLTASAVSWSFLPMRSSLLAITPSHSLHRDLPDLAYWTENSPARSLSALRFVALPPFPLRPAEVLGALFAASIDASMRFWSSKRMCSKPVISSVPCGENFSKKHS